MSERQEEKTLQPEIPERETLIVTESDIRDAVEDDSPTVFPAEDQNLRYVVDVETVEQCAREGCDGAGVFEAKNDEGYCSPECMEADLS